MRTIIAASSVSVFLGAGGCVGSPVDGGGTTPDPGQAPPSEPAVLDPPPEE